MTNIDIAIAVNAVIWLIVLGYIGAYLYTH